tara:strand:+ start:694 stop:1227 length:534 start_codon:yes stop_codon:yes gene_type:complete
MKKIIQHKKFLSKQNKKFIDIILNHSIFPFYFNKKTVTGPKEDYIFSHVLINRYEDREERNFPYKNSKFADEAIDILNNFCKKNKLKYSEIFRAAVNFTVNNNTKQCGWHKDHFFEHRQLIVYLNDADPNSTTLLKVNNKIIKIKPEKYKGVCFNNVEHGLIFPKKGYRVALIFTFK